jgi:hypothetical protein
MSNPEKQQFVSYRGAIRSASLVLLERFRLHLDQKDFTTKELNKYIRDTSDVPASRRRKIVAAVLSAGISNKWIDHLSIGVWSFTERGLGGFFPASAGADCSGSEEPDQP